MDNIPQPRPSIIDAKSLHDELLNAAGNDLIIVDVGHTDEKPGEYVDGAIYVDLRKIDVNIYDDEACKKPSRVEGNFNLKPDADVREAFESMGIHEKSIVVCYTQSFKKGYKDQVVCGRFLWALLYAGVTDVRLLDGGIAKWRAAGFAVSPQPAAPRPCTTFTVRNYFPLRPYLNTRCDEVESIVSGESPGTILADVRTWEEYTGKCDQYEYHVGLGRIPNARWAHWGTDTYCGSDYMLPNGHMRDLDEVLAFWQEWGITRDCAGPGRRIVFYCGSGWRSAYATVLSLMLGFENVSSYDGGFLEWNRFHGNSDAHDIDRGPTPPMYK